MNILSLLYPEVIEHKLPQRNIRRVINVGVYNNKIASTKSERTMRTWAKRKKEPCSKCGIGHRVISPDGICRTSLCSDCTTKNNIIRNERRILKRKKGEVK